MTTFIMVTEVNMSCSEILINTNSIESIRSIQFPIKYPDARCSICCSGGTDYIVSDTYDSILGRLLRNMQ